MPSSSIKQRNYVFYLRGKYKTKSDTPEKWKWVWNDEWLTVKEHKLLKRYIPLFEKDSKYLTLYHGTDSLFIDKIKHNGIISNNYSPSWYMLSSTKPSAIFHSTYAEEIKMDTLKGS